MDAHDYDITRGLPRCFGLWGTGRRGCSYVTISRTMLRVLCREKDVMV